MRKLVAHYYVHDSLGAVRYEFDIRGRDRHQKNWIDLFANQNTRNTRIPRLKGRFEI